MPSLPTRTPSDSSLGSIGRSAICPTRDKTLSRFDDMLQIQAKVQTLRPWESSGYSDFETLGYR